jgi:hypothetical protein
MPLQNKWNISKEKGEECAHKYIIEILRDSDQLTIALPQLVKLLDQRTKHITFIYGRKHKPISFYLKNVYGSFINFIDTYSFYGVSIKRGTTHIILIDRELYHTTLTSPTMDEYREWTLVDTIDEPKDT